VASGVEAEEERAEVVDGPSEAACEAVPVVVVELEAWGAVVVQSVGPGAVYATEVKGRLKSRHPLLRTGYLGGTRNGG
jgi:hypothetical protein